MNIIELQDNLKDVSDNVLMKEMQSPSGNMPQFLVLSELTRRRRMRDDYKRQQAANMPTVAEEVMTAAGAPQEGLTAIARNMAPNSSIAQNTGADMAVQREPTRMPQMMADGGVLSLFRGGRTKEDLYRQVEPFPENGTATEKRTWNLTYGMTHNVDGTPKMMSPDVATTDVSPFQQGLPYAFKDRSPFISDVSADIGDFMPTVPDASQDPSTDLDIGGILAGAQQFDFDRPFAQQDATGGLPVAAPDFDATDENDILDAEEARLVQQEVLDANRGDQPLPDVSQIDPETNLDISGALGVGSLGQNLADAINNQPTSPNISSALAEQLPNFPIRGSDTRASQQLAEFLESRRSDLPGVNLPGESDPYVIDPDAARKAGDSFSVSDQLIAQGFTGGDIDPSMAPNQSSLQSDLADALKFAVENDKRNEALDRLDPPDNPPPSVLAAQEQEQGILSSLFNNPLLDLMGGNDKASSDTSGSFYPELPVSASDVEGPMIEQIIEDNTTGGGQQNDPNILDTLETGGTGTGGAVSNPYGALESRIARMLEERDKSAEADKWLALAQTGLALMASDNPTLAGAIGEAGLVGLSQLRESKSQYDKDILGLLTTQADIDAARRAEDLAERKFGLSEKEFELAKAEALLPEGLSATEKAAYIKQYGNARSRLREINVALQTGMLSSGEGLERVQIPLTEEDIAGLRLEKAQLESDVNMFGGLANPAFANIQAAE